MSSGSLRVRCHNYTNVKSCSRKRGWNYCSSDRGSHVSHKSYSPCYSLTTQVAQQFANQRSPGMRSLPLRGPGLPSSVSTLYRAFRTEVPAHFGM